MNIDSKPKVNTVENTAETKEKLSLNILVADDQEMMRELFKNFLESQGHKVKVVEDGELLLDELLRGNESYDVVVSDNNMPRKKGIEVLREIRSMEGKFRTLPFIIATTDGPKLITEIDKLGGLYFEKPFAVEELSEAIRKVTKDKV
ncbi:MAG: Sensory box protein [Parcubacteria group bacterium GW2011_GWB1_36_5]|nr:MAG: Sensory box protein [Parcubacteria group bacterium GW2011_GWA2_36_24]KKQ07281.1 MAG: Sensory box protein [Parcubacteria group bacterium GW2011_GWB1_36_5]